MSNYEKVFDYAGAYENEAWGTASPYAWDRLAAIAGEYQRGEYGWDRARELIEDTMRDAGVSL